MEFVIFLFVCGLTCDLIYLFVELDFLSFIFSGLFFYFFLYLNQVLNQAVPSTHWHNVAQKNKRPHSPKKWGVSRYDNKLHLMEKLHFGKMLSTYALGSTLTRVVVPVRVASLDQRGPFNNYFYLIWSCANKKKKKKKFMNVNMNVQWIWFLNFWVQNKQRWVEMLLNSIIKVKLDDNLG